MLVLIGIAQIALDRQTWKIKYPKPKPSWQALTPPPLTGNVYTDITHFKKGLP